MKQLAAVEKASTLSLAYITPLPSLQAALKQLLDHTIDNKSVLVEDTDYAVVPAPFVRAWKRWALRPSSNDRPTHIDTAQFLCEHDGLVLDLTMASDWSNVFTLIKFGHWEGLIQQYVEHICAYCHLVAHHTIAIPMDPSFSRVRSMMVT